MYATRSKPRSGVWLLTFLLICIIVFVFPLCTCTAQSPKGTLELFHWWTEGGEWEALQKMYDLFLAKYPGVKIVDNPVGGGGGVNIRAVLTSKLAAGMPPDTFQELEGTKIKIYFDSGYLSPIDDVWQETNYEEKYLLDPHMVKFGGHYYAMPCHAHRANYMWYDKELFDELHIAPPKDLDDLVAICKLISKSKPDIVPIALGTRYKWLGIYLFDKAFLPTAGPDFYKNFYTGRVDITESDIFRKSLEKLKELIPYMYRFHAATTNFEAADMIVSGKAAITLQGDWTYGHFLSVGWEDGKQLGGVPFPQDIWIGHPDVFVFCKNAPHPEIAKLWLKHLAEPETQIAFSLLKGSTACIKGVPPDTYPEPFRQTNMQQLNDPTVTKMGNAFAVLTTTAFVEDFQDIIAQFLYDGDIDLMIENAQKALDRDEVAKEMEWYWE